VIQIVVEPLPHLRQHVYLLADTILLTSFKCRVGVKYYNPLLFKFIPHKTSGRLGIALVIPIDIYAVRFTCPPIWICSSKAQVGRGYSGGDDNCFEDWTGLMMLNACSGRDDVRDAWPSDGLCSWSETLPRKIRPLQTLSHLKFAKNFGEAKEKPRRRRGHRLLPLVG